MSADLFAPPPKHVVRVALPLPVDQLFDYAVPAALASAALPGCRVRVRAGNRTHTGVIVEEATQAAGESAKQLAGESAKQAAGESATQLAGESATPSDPGVPLREIEAVLDEQPVIAPRLLGVLREEADHLLCPLGVALAAAIPAGSSPRTRRLLGLTPRGREALRLGAVAGESRALLALLEAGPKTPASLRAKLGPAPLERVPDLERDGLLAPATGVTGPSVRAARVRLVSAAPELDLEAARTTLGRAPSQRQLLERLVAKPYFSE